jgi:hypothetical protein
VERRTMQTIERFAKCHITSGIEKEEVEHLADVDWLFYATLQDADELVCVLQDNRLLFPEALVGECV